MLGYGAVPPSKGAGPLRSPRGRQSQVALVGLATVVALVVTALSSSQSPVVLSGGSWLSELESQFSDAPRNMHEKAVRMQLAGRPSPGAPALLDARSPPPRRRRD